MGAAIVTLEVSALVPPCWVTMTRKLPGAAPAVYRPLAVIVPPVAEYVTEGTVAEPSLQVPATANWRLAPGAKATAAGVRMTPVRLGGGGETLTTDVSARSPAAEATMTRYVPSACPAV